MSQVQHLYCVSREVGWESGARVVNMSVSADVDRKCRQVVGWESGARVGSMSASAECRPEVSTSSCAIDGTRTHILLLDREVLQPIELRRQEVFGRKSRRLGE